MASALFDVNADGGNQGFQATNAQVLTLRLRQQPPIGVNTLLFQVFDPAGFNPLLGIAANPPRASKSAPTLTIVGATAGQAVSPVSVDGSVNVTLPGTGSHSWIVRCVVNGGMKTLPSGDQVVDPTLIVERGIWIPTVLGARKVVCTETRQFSDGGWADALTDLPDFIVADHTIPLIKLPLAAAAPSIVGAAVNGNFLELPLSTFRGVGLTLGTDGKLAPRARMRKLTMVDLFITGGLTSGTIGAYGWNLLGAGTPAISQPSHTGLGSRNKLTLTTSAGLTDRSVLCLGTSESKSLVVPGDVAILQMITTFAGALTNKRFFFGIHDDFSQIPSAATSCLGFWFDSAVGGNWLLLARDGSVGVPVNTGVAVASDTGELITMLKNSSTSFSFYSGNTLLGTISSGVPSDVSNVGMAVYNVTATSKSQNIGGFCLNSNEVGGSLDDDTFLEA